ncbi:MAG: ACT domain-containing protein [Fermentimonas caenicola]
MHIKQLSVFLEDRSGRLTELTRILAVNDINITALSVAETADYGIVRMVVGRPELAKDVLEKAGFSIGLTDVVCINMPDQPGSLYNILEILTDDGINVDYMYAFSNNDVALAVIRAADIQRVTEVLDRNRLKLLSQSDIYQL